PFILFLLALVTMLPFVHGLEDWLLAHVGQLVPGEAYTMIAGVIRSLLAQPRGGLLSLGAILALWSASTAVTGVMGALNVAYGVPEKRPWWKVRLIAIGTVVATSFFMILAFVLAVSSGPLAAWVAGLLGPAGGIGLMVGNWVVALAAITLVIATIYHVGPDVDFPWRSFSPGAVSCTLRFVRQDLRVARRCDPPAVVDVPGRHAGAARRRGERISRSRGERGAAAAEAAGAG